ncbi:hypothetical protein ACFE04_003992 [Oxalis oulophora]
MNYGATTLSLGLRLVVKASWDTEQRLPYNRNAPRKIKKEKEPPLVIVSTNNNTSINYQSVSNILKKPTSKVIENKSESNNDYLGYERWLPSAPKVEKPRSTYNAASLAYIGDCIYELYARRHFMFPPLHIEEFNDRVMAVVRCEAQDVLLQKLIDENYLTQEERDVLRWGKNIGSAKTKTRRRAGSAVYNRASSLETLIGYLYARNVNRLDEVMQKLGFSTGDSTQAILEEANGLPAQGHATENQASESNDTVILGPRKEGHAKRSHSSNEIVILGPKTEGAGSRTYVDDELNAAFPFLV